ncbi:IclR family transcriptional regulator [Desulfoscipio geothermicus]|uniref:Transcriptional regulator, IclR family n=1 Tax=Desulfoscipio geothermicus DSM 3669 TaxID=1121426 RepID=A0A1I6D6E3_9FIRM|nr:IclR family transcriptional regulator [Desulfoscipio geothermicus]SFR00897.1 transcriptional regulator, IclR family [Desulfoscipio geothermicus DSM 3669]
MTEVRAVKRAFEILEVLCKEKEPQSLASLHKTLGLSKTTLARILNTLEKGGYVERDSSLQKYALGMKFLHYSYAVSERLTVKQVAAPILRRIRDSCMETVYIYFLHNNQRICIDCLQGKSAVRVMVYLGQESPLYAGASGKAILAYFSKEELEKYFNEVELKPLTPNTIINRDLLEQDLKLIRQRGYATSIGEKVSGVISVSAPIWDKDGKVTSTLSIAAPMDRQSEIENFIQLVKEGAAEISSYHKVFKF